MAKPSLGRGLGDLMQGTQVTGARSQVTGAPTGSGDVNIAPGLNSILRGAKPPKTLVVKATDSSADFVSDHARQTRLIQCSLIGADLLLSGLAALIIFKRTAPLGLGEALLCCAAVALGAWLSCLAVILDREPD